MNTKVKRKLKRVFAVFLALVTAFAMTACGGHQFDSYRPITDVNNLEGRKVGVNLAWSADYLLSGRDDMILYRYDGTADMLMALCYKQLDAIAVDFVTGKYILAYTTGLSQVEQNISIEGYIVVSNPDNKRFIEAFDKWLEDYKKTPEYAAWEERVMNFDGGNYEPMNLECTGTGELFKVGTYMDNYPLDYKDTDGVMKGFEVELIIQFANAMNYTLDITGTGETDIYSGVNAGIYNMVIGSLSTLYSGDYAAVGYPFSQTYLELPVMFIEISDPDNLALTGFIEAYGADE